MATTGICDSFKQEAMQGGHCLNATSSQSGTTHATTTLDGLTSTANICRGMSVSGTNIAGSTFVADISSATAVVLSIAATGSATNTMTFTGDALKILLIKASPARTFDHTQTNVGTPGAGASSTSNVGTDETSGTGYASGGSALVNTTPALVSGTAVGTFANVSWTSASFSATAAVIYNTASRLGAAATPITGRTVSVHDFGGTQTVTAGTFTLVMPTADNVSGLLRIA